MASKSNEPPRISAEDLAKMKTHDMAELLSNFVLLLRRLPNIPFSELAEIPTTEQQQPTRVDFVSKARNQVNGRELPGWAGQEDKPNLQAWLDEEKRRLDIARDNLEQ